MTDTLKVLGQSNPAASTLTDLYTVPGATTATVSSLVVCNLTTLDEVFRLSVSVAGAADTLKQYLYYDVPVQGNDTFSAVLGVTLGAADVVRCQSRYGGLSFAVFGVQVA